MVRISRYLEPIALCVFIFSFLFVGLANPFLNQIKHSRPHAHLASDAFFHYSLAEYMEAAGTIKFTPSYEVGGHPLIFDQHPPALSELAALFSKVSGLEVYDSIYLLIVITALLTILIFYVLARKVRKEIAYSSLPVTFLIFSKNFNVGFFWGFWLFVLGVFFMIASFWAIINLELKKSYLLLGIFLSATTLSHVPETAYAAVFAGIFLGRDFIRNRKINFDFIKKLVIAAIITIVLSIYHINIFSRTILISEGYRNVWDLKNVAYHSGLPEMPLIALGIAGIVALIGFVLFLLIKKGKTGDAASVSLYSFILGYFILLGVGKRSYTHRFFWFVYISFFFGFAIYQIIRILAKKWTHPASFVVILILIAVIAAPLSKSTKVGSGILDQGSWDALVWMGGNIPEDKLVYYFYSDAYANKALMYSSYHVSFIIGTKDFVEKLNQGQISRKYLFGIADSYRDYLCPLGKFKLGYYRNRLMPKNDPGYKCEEGYKKLERPPEEDSNKDICAIEYAVFAKAAVQPAFAQYNMAIRDTLLKADWIEEIYSNNMISILRNNNPGVDCIGS